MDLFEYLYGDRPLRAIGIAIIKELSREAFEVTLEEYTLAKVNNHFTVDVTNCFWETCIKYEMDYNLKKNGINYKSDTQSRQSIQLLPSENEKYQKANTLVLLHEFWCCKKELTSFLTYKAFLQNGETESILKLACFTSYGNFICYLYDFYEGIIELKHPDLPCNGLEVSKILTQEVEKIMKNQIQATTGVNTNDGIVIPQDFGTYLRRIRVWFSHVKKERIIGEKNGIDLFEFYTKYHGLAVALFESANLSWSTKADHNWSTINDFADKLVKNSQQ